MRRKLKFGEPRCKNRVKQILFIVLVLLVIGIVAGVKRAEYKTGAARVDQGIREGDSDRAATPEPDRAEYVRDLLWDDPYRDELAKLCKKDARICQIAERREQYPDRLIETLIQYPETAGFVLGYPDHAYAGRDDAGITEKVDRGEIPLLIQWDERWGYCSYGSSMIGISGCGPTCLSMVLVGLTGQKKYDPAWVASYSEDNGYWVEGTGTSWELMWKGAADLGLRAERLPLQPGILRDRLEDKIPVICSVKPGDFTNTGHFIVLTGLDENGKIMVCDPNSRINSRKTWGIKRVMRQIKSMWAYKMNSFLK